MNKKELKRLAQQIANLELVIQQSSDSYEVNEAKNTIMNLTGRVEDMEDLFILDELISQMLNKKQNKEQN